jgi:hypothetical protein
MTFPVAYPIEVKDKILASFRRGLMRSLPESLIADEQFNQFSVREWASEPAAYAAAALEKLNIEPTEQGVAYAVFDFGGVQPILIMVFIENRMSRKKIYTIM